MGLFKKKTTENKLDTDLNISKSPKKKWKKWQKITLGVCGGFVALIVIVGIATAGGNGKKENNSVAEMETSTAAIAVTDVTSETTHTETTISSTVENMPDEAQLESYPSTQAPTENPPQQDPPAPAQERYVPQTQATYDHSDAKEYTYILNTSTHKFHRNGCDQISKIKPKNYSTFTGTREQAISNGYSPCKKCNP